MRITLRQLTIFLSVYETSQVSKSARMLSMSVSAVSQNIKDLEDALNSKLFVRRSAGLVPTEAGKTLLPYATQIVDKSREVEDLFANIQTGNAGHINIGSNRNFGIYVLSRKLLGFKHRMPSVSTSLMIDDNHVIERAVLERKLDVGFISSPPSNPELESFPCFEDRKCIVAGIASPLISPYVSARELSNATWVLDHEEEERKSALEWLQQRGINAKSQVIMNTMGAIKRAVGTGLGLGVLPYLAVREEIMRGDLVEIMKPKHDADPGTTYNRIYAVYLPDVNAGLRNALFRNCEIKHCA